MSNKKRAHLLFLSGLIYSGLSVGFMGCVVLGGNSTYLKLSFLCFILMSFSLIFSMNFNSTDYDQLRPWVFKISFLLLVPLWCISTFLTFVIDICLRIFPALEKEQGGDSHDEE